MHKFEIYRQGGKGRKWKGWKMTSSEHKLIVFTTARFARQIICHKMFIILHLEKTLTAHYAERKSLKHSQDKHISQQIRHSWTGGSATAWGTRASDHAQVKRTSPSTLVRHKMQPANQYPRAPNLLAWHSSGAHHLLLPRWVRASSEQWRLPQTLIPLLI